MNIVHICQDFIGTCQEFRQIFRPVSFKHFDTLPSLFFQLKNNYGVKMRIAM